MAVAILRKELKEAREKLAAGLVQEKFIEKIHARYTYRMHDLSEFMKGVMQRFTQWFNGKHKRSGTLWEQRFKSVIVEDGLAARTMAAYIDLNPVRAGMVTDPAEYRWSGYGEACGGGAKGDGKRAREEIIRAWMAHKGWNGDAKYWSSGGRQGNIHADYRAMLLIEGVEKIEEVMDATTGRLRDKLVRKGMSKVEGRRSKVEGRRSKVEGRRSKVEGRSGCGDATIGSRTRSRDCEAARAAIEVFIEWGSDRSAVVRGRCVPAVPRSVRRTAEGRCATNARRCGRADEDKWVVEFAGFGGRVMESGARRSRDGLVRDAPATVRGDAAGLTNESGLWSMRDLGVTGDQ